VEFRNFLLSAMTKADQAVVVPELIEMFLPKGEIIFDAGAQVESVYFPSSAVLSVITVMKDGRSAESNSIGREGAAGLLCAASSSPTLQLIIAQIAGGAFRLPAGVFRRLLISSPTFASQMFSHAAAEVAQAQQFIACNVLHAAEQRLARWLLMTADRTGGDSFLLTQDYMGIMTGVQRTTISAMASELKQRGLIRYSRGHMDILDRSGLEAVACECAKVARDLFIPGAEKRSGV
jgi:CRP-like cAMP-binding protein